MIGMDAARVRDATTRQDAIDPNACRIYRHAVKAASANLRICGLGPGLAMLLGDDGGKLMFDHLSAWLLEAWPGRPEWPTDGTPPPDRPGRLAWLIDAPQAVYFARRREALAYADWLKRLSDPWDD